MSPSLIKSKEQIALMRQAGQIVGSLLYDLEKMVQSGICPSELDRYAREITKQRGGQPAFLGYDGFPATLCISVNDAVVHGIPDARPFLPGDVVGIDAGAIVDGWYADAALTVLIPPAPRHGEHLLQATQRALEAGIDRVHAGYHLGDVQAAIEQVIHEAGLGIVRDLTGHGIGQNLHEEPQIPNYGRPGSGPILRAGMTICLEPMTTVGDPTVYLDRDGWTIRTRDGSLGAQFEHTILVTDGEPEILTAIRPWPSA